MLRVTLRLLVICALIAICTAVTSADPIPAPRFPAGNLLKNAEFTNGLNNWKLVKTNGKDKVKCGGVGHNSDCAFRFVGKNVTEATTLTQVITPASAGSGARVAVVANAEVYARSLSGTSCLAYTLTVKFNNPGVAALKGTFNACGTGVLQAWASTGEFGDNTSFGENSYKKIILKIKHTGIGEWLVDTASVTFEAK